MISIAIVSHASRRLRVEKLSAVINAEFVAVDDGTLGPGANHDVAWRWLADGTSEWGVVLEDDALPVKGFRQQLKMALAAAPGPIVSLYLGRGRPPNWQPSIQQVIVGENYFLQASELLHHVGVAIRTPLIGQMLGRV